MFLKALWNDIAQADSVLVKVRFKLQGSSTFCLQSKVHFKKKLSVFFVLFYVQKNKPKLNCNHWILTLLM